MLQANWVFTKGIHGDAMNVYIFLKENKNKEHNKEKAKKAQDLIDPKHREPTPTKAPPSRGK